MRDYDRINARFNSVICDSPAVYTEGMFKTTHDAANREVVKAVIRGELNLVGLAMRAERKVIDKIVGGLKFHG